MLAAPPVKVLYLTGTGRSGSTLLECLLNLVPGVEACGEVNFLWERSLGRGDSCGCGRGVRECPAWGPAVAALSRAEQAEAEELHRQTARYRALLGRALGRADADATARYRALLARLYRARRDATGARVLVDASKHPGYGAVLAGAPGLDVRVVHLVRDARACAFSWQRSKAFPGTPDPDAEMVRYGPVYASLDWLAGQLGSEWLARRASRLARVRYEDLASDPLGVFDALGELLGEPLAGAEILARAAEGMPENHTISGNPLRFRRAGLAVRADREWERALGLGSRLVVTALTFPLLARYGYL